jgi:YfiH family protein
VSQLTSDFEWASERWGRALRSRSLAKVARHLFTSRQLRLRGSAVDERREWEAVARSVGVEADRLVRLRQVHGRDVVTVRRTDDWRDRGRPAPPADILVSDDPDVALAIQVADCIPLLLADPHTGVAAATHAGWRGMAAAVPQVAVQALFAQFGARPRDLVAAAGPSIGPCCYEVGPEVRSAFDAAPHGRLANRWFAASRVAEGGTRPRPGHLMLDLWQALEDQLVDAGLAPANIHLSRLCTACHPEDCWSYRRDGPGTSRLAGVVRPAPTPRP